MIVFDIAKVAPGLNTLLRLHWRGRHAMQKIWDKILWEERVQIPARQWPIEHAAIRITRHSLHTLDHDNLNGSAKIVLDALKHANIIADDSPAHIDLKITQCRGKPRTLIHIEALP